MGNFNSKGMLGMWYEQYRSQNVSVANGECVTAYLKDLGNGYTETKVSHQEYYPANKNYERHRES